MPGNRTPAATTLILFLVAIANLFSKKIATVYGVSFTIVLYLLLLISEKINSKKHAHVHGAAELEKFNLDHQPQINAGTLHAHPGSGARGTTSRPLATVDSGNWKDYAQVAGSVGVATALALLLRPHLGATNLAMVYLLAWWPSRYGAAAGPPFWHRS